MKKLFFVAFVIATFTACKNNATTTNGEQANTASNTSGAGVSDILSSTPSLLYESETVMPQGMGTTKAKVYIDDNGKKFRMEAVTSISFGGKSMNTISNSLKLDEYVYTWSNMGKNGNKIKVNPSEIDPNTTDFASLTEDMKKKFSLKEEGSETINGKNCTIYSFSAEKMQGKIWQWKGVPMKSEMNIMGQTVTTTVTKVEENPTFPAGTFDVPSGITFIEMATQAATAEQ
ncbi:MAG TPA: hypothetical protein PLJ42_01070 [Chitinophagales bacterium]|jgi:outer membrane lipoprotein-sorting protein|nr:hypothetical protein [Chitinophagales bacterium]MBP6153538.1 hypothetical protein [Chitinophagales bacterium]HQV76940.1 hypothetical protein [Chitinophagales bacterium]HQW77993.1 hypothetical protein [Chitinophagales bacterium]HRB18494.1 hypothetical protein [Chitinophagales bacterium]